MKPGSNARPAPKLTAERVIEGAVRLADRIGADALTIRNVRNARYHSPNQYIVFWERRQYDLARLDSVWFVVEPFSDWRGPAHTFLSFGFDDGQYLAISVEIRKELGESFSPWLGLLRQYELTYVTDSVTLTRGTAVTVAGVSYQVREAPRQLDDGAFSAVLLSRV